MRLRVHTTTGGEVVFAGNPSKGRSVYYGAPPETGLWQIDTPKFEDFLSGELALRSFGGSIEEFVFGLEIAELEEWGRWFKETRNYMSYRPKSKQLISVGQIEWKDVKELAADAQLEQLKFALTVAIERIANLNRKPRDFDYVSFGAAVQESLKRCTTAMVAA